MKIGATCIGWVSNVVVYSGSDFHLRAGCTSRSGTIGTRIRNRNPLAASATADRGTPSGSSASTIELSSRQVYLAGYTSQPTSGWVMQQARQFVWQLQESSSRPRFLLHDHDTKFTATFDAVFVSERIEIILTPPQTLTPNASYARFVRNAWTTSCLSANAISCRCSGSTWPMTTRHGLTKAWTSKPLSHTLPASRRALFAIVPC